MGTPIAEDIITLGRLREFLAGCDDRYSYGLSINGNVLTIVRGSGNTSVTVPESSSTSLNNVTGTLSVSNGGTGATTAYNARVNLDAAQNGGAQGSLGQAESNINSLNVICSSLSGSIGDNESDFWAEDNHAIGDLFMIGSILKVATTAIASGEQIDDSNSSNTNVVEQLNAVDDKVGTINTKIGNVGSTSLQSQVNTINTKIGNVGSTSLQSQVNTINTKIGSVGSTSLQSQVNTVSGTASNAKAKTDKLSVWDTSIDFVLSDTLTIRLGAATNRVYLQLCQNGTWTGQKNIASW